MAILSIPETVPAQQANRGPDSSSSLPDNEKENQHLHHVESGSVPQNKVILYYILSVLLLILL